MASWGLQTRICCLARRHLTSFIVGPYCRWRGKGAAASHPFWIRNEEKKTTKPTGFHWKSIVRQIYVRQHFTSTRVHSIVLMYLQVPQSYSQPNINTLLVLSILQWHAFLCIDSKCWQRQPSILSNSYIEIRLFDCCWHTCHWVRTSLLTFLFKV